MQSKVEKTPTPKVAGRLTTRQKCPHPHHHSNVASRIHSCVRRDGAIARSKRRRRRGRADRPLGEFVRGDVWHQSRVNGHSNQSLTDISNDIMEALLENVVHSISRYRACGEICRFSLFTWVRCCQGKALRWQVGLCRGVVLMQAALANHSDLCKYVQDHLDLQLDIVQELACFLLLASC